LKLTLTEEQSKEIEKAFREQLQKQLDESKAEDKFTDTVPMFAGVWEGLHIATDKETIASTDTAVPETELLDIANKITTLPKDKAFFKKIEKLFEDRSNMVKNRTFDWAMGELLAYGTLLTEGNAVRLSG
jgi:2-oxoglutarate dehydrogenase E1 component